MNLASPPDSYSVRDQAQMREAIRRADQDNLKRGRDITRSGDTADLLRGRLILVAPDGGLWQVLVDNTGTLSTAPL